MSESNRRDFLQTSGTATLGTAALGAVAVSALAQRSASAANNKIVIAGIGCGGRGTAVTRGFAGHPDVEVAMVCDPDDARAAKAAKAMESVQGRAPKVERDLRKALEDESIDAIVIGTPDHWHGPAAILGVEAGKHVYVEKPCSHNIREGRLMVEAARRNNKVIQVGTQSRSADHIVQAMDRLHNGAIGEILVAKAWDSQLRRNIGHASPSDPPAGFDYDLWLGPAPEMPFQANRHHYTWHWWYATGTGDMGNDGVHDLDIARWGLGVDRHPNRVVALGGKYFFDDDQQFPDTQTVIFEYAPQGNEKRPRQLIYEQRIWSPYRQEGFENGNAFYGTAGMMLFGKNDGWQLFGPKNKLIESMQPTPRDEPHQQNFIDCIRSGGRPNADIEIGHYSAAICHLGNIATRLGRALEFDPQAEKFVSDQEANKLVAREYRPGHWAVPKGV